MRQQVTPGSGPNPTTTLRYHCQVLRKSPADVYRVRSRVSDVAAALNVRTSGLLTTKWMPLATEVASRHEALRLPVALEV